MEIIQFTPLSTLGLKSTQLWLLYLGLFLLFLSLTYRIKRFMEIDQKVFKYINTYLKRFSKFFRYIWPLGTTPVAILLVVMTYLHSNRVGFLTTIVFFTLSIIEWIIKKNLKRERPFISFPETKMAQPTQPEDLSFPSGDAMRVWFLALSIPMTNEMPTLVILCTCILGSLISLGRIALGVHYPLDVLGGMGLGCLGAAIVSIGMGFTFLPYI